MSEYDSPLRDMKSYIDTTTSDDQQPDNSINGSMSSFVSTPPPRREFRPNWRDRTSFAGRGHRNRNPNAFRHSTPYNYNKRNSDNSPYNRGPFNSNSYQNQNNEAKGYFHPTMLDNPWAEMEKKYESVEKNAINVSKMTTEEESSSDEADTE